MAAQTELPKIESMQRFNEEKCLSSILLMYRFLMCMIMALMCISMCFLPSFYSDLCLEREIQTQRNEVPEAKVGLYT